MSKTLLTIELLLNSVSLLSQSVDPTAGGGVPAVIGSKYYRSGTAGDYTKTGAGNTAWTLTATGIYFNVKDYGATGDGVTDDRAAIQLAIDDAAVNGGTVYFPPGTYVCGKDGANPWSFRINGLSGIRFLGTGLEGSTLVQTGSAAAGAYHLIQVDGGSDATEFEELVLDQSGLTNPGAGLCALLEVTEATATKVINCRFQGGVATAGAYIHTGDVAGDVVSVVFIDQCELVDAGGPCIQFGSGTRNAWLTDSFVSNESGATDTVLLDDTNGDGIQDVKIMGTEISNDAHFALRGTSTGGEILRLQVANCLVLGWVAFDSLLRCQIQQLVIAASVTGVSDPVVVIEDSSQVQFQKCNVRRVAGADAGLIVRLTDVDLIQVQGNHWVQETDETGLLVLAGVGSVIQLQANTGYAFDAGSSTVDAYHIEADGGLITNLQITGECITAEAGSWNRALFITASNGGTIGAVQVIPGVLSDCDTGVLFDDGGAGAGTFTEPGLLMVAGGAIDAATAAWDITVSTVFIRTGSNACTFGPQVLAGNGDPNGAATARVGSMFTRLDGGAGSTLYIKETGTGNTGWTAK